MTRTHEEYLAWIDKQIGQRKKIYASIERNSPKVPDPLVEFHDVGIASLLALRAVVELHKPEWVLLKIVLGGTKPDPVAICSHCSDEQWRKSYPCPTIQAIEKELG